MSVNTVALIGNLTRDPELRDAGGTPVCSLRVAVNARAKVDGEWTDKPNYFDVTVFGSQGENAAKFLEKGRPVGIAGRLDWREWEDGDGNKRQAVQIIAHEVQFLGSAKDRDEVPQAEATPDADVGF
jgi:single-strand DNA-binding protein